MIIFPLLMVGLVSFFVKTQFTIYRQYLPMKVSSEIIPGELSRNQLQLTFEELGAITGSYEFHSLLAKLIVKSPKFKSMSFTSLSSKTLRTWNDDFAICRANRSCETEKVAALVGSMIDFKKGTSAERYIFELSSLSPETLKVISPIFSEAIQLFRIQTIQKAYKNQEKLVLEMIEKSRSSMSTRGGFEALAQIKGNDLKLQELRDMISGLQHTINQDSSILATLEFQLKETHSLARGMDVGESEKLLAEKMRKKQIKINDLRQNIAALNSLSDSERTSSENLVLTQIQKELRVLESEVLRTSSTTVRFSEKESFNTLQQSNKNTIDFDYKVMKKKLEQERSDLNEFTNLAASLVEENLNLENKSVSLKQDLDSIKNLDARLLTIRMMEYSTKSDIVFDERGGELDEFNRSSQSQNLLYSFIISFILVFLVLLVRYFLDDRIYEVHEIEKCFKDLPIIGKTPDFD